MRFKDHFSVQAADYARFRPTYPNELFEYLAGIAPQRKIAWDCATGNGQAAVALAARFDRVIATDASEKQISHAQPHERVVYSVAPAENSGIDSGTIDLVTVAQALHWFNLPAFHAEAKRVLKPGGAIAVWNYVLLQITPQIDAIIARFYDEIVGPFWPPERRVVERGYQHLPFPFAELEPPEFRMATRWTLDQVLGYLCTWSATQRFIEARREDPIAAIASDLRDVWGTPEHERAVDWPLAVRVGRYLG